MSKIFNFYLLSVYLTGLGLVLFNCTANFFHVRVTGYTMSFDGPEFEVTCKCLIYSTIIAKNLSAHSVGKCKSKHAWLPNA